MTKAKWLHRIFRRRGQEGKKAGQAGTMRAASNTNTNTDANSNTNTNANANANTDTNTGFSAVEVRRAKKQGKLAQ